LERVAGAVRELGGEALALQCDVTDPQSIAAVVEETIGKLGPINVLVNNAGSAESHKFIGHDDALWRRMIDINLNSVYYVSKAVAPMMVEAKWGRIINIASIASKVGGRYIAAYTASKHAVLGLTRVLALELVAYNVTVNAICPGYVDTPMTERGVANIVGRTQLSEREVRATFEKLSPQNRLIAPEEVAHVAVMLLSEEARGVNGQAINIDGGGVMF
jgi:NAD(P)-dependent dehydrogenase (short-subunit alcohol dehydrogenase family)